MSHFFGCINFNTIENPSEIGQKMKTALSFFKADAQGEYVDNQAYMCNMVLHNTIESQSVTGLIENERFVLAASCRLDNREELFQKLNLTGNVFGKNAISDQELILICFEKYGEACVQYLIGDFSFVIWDKVKHRTFMVKDQMGTRPLFYLKNKNFLLFSTSVSVIKAAFDAPLKISDLYVSYNLKQISPPVELTFFVDILRLKPAHFIFFERKESVLVEKKYWELKTKSLTEFKTDEARLNELRSLFEIAVSCRIRTTKNVGCQLSGGLDSSVITVKASQIIDKERLHTFSFVLNEKTKAFSKNGIDEQETQNLIIDFAALKKANHHVIEEHRFKDVFEELEHTNLIMGGYADSDSIWQDTMFQKAKEQGVGVCLSGFPGDECVSNSGQYYHFSFLHDFNLKKVLGFIKDFKLRALKRIYMYFVFKAKGTLKPGIDKTLERRVFLAPKSKFDFAVKNKAFTFYPTLEEYLITYVCRPHTCLRTESEGAYALSHGIESAYPLADIRLLEFVVSLPTEMFKPKPMSRMLFRNMCLGLLPEKVRLQNKNNGALTLAFAEYWKEKQLEEFKDLKFKHFVLKPNQAHDMLDLGQKSALIKTYKMEWMLGKNY
jgi:asparagine synthase (glutamine-hydrolysing)